MIVSIFFFLNVAHGTEIVIENSQGEFVHLDVDPSVTIEEVQAYVDLIQPESFALHREGDLVAMGPPRDYHAPLSTQEQADIRYVVNTLSDVHTTKLMIYQLSLNRARDRILHVHPLIFMGFIFSDPVLKVKVRNIKSKSWVWPQFIAGFRDSMNDEHHRDNLLPEFYEGFANLVGIDLNKLDHPITQTDWEAFVLALIKFVAHDTNADRYNM